MTVFGDYHDVGHMSYKNAVAIKEMAGSLPCRGRLDAVRMDPAASARSALGPAAYGEYERVFGERLMARWPQHPVLDGLDTIDLLLDLGNLTIHPRCVKLKEAFGNYRRQRRAGEWIDFPEDGHPEEDMMDALRGGIRDALPEGGILKPEIPPNARFADLVRRRRSEHFQEGLNLQHWLRRQSDRRSAFYVTLSLTSPAKSSSV